MFEQVKQEIDDKIKTNGNNEITATRLNGVLQDMMDASAEVIEEVQRSIGDQVEANPTEAATDSLEKIKIGENVYNIPDPDTSGLATKQELQQGLATKQDTISDLSTIRSGASAGATAVQPSEMEAAIADVNPFVGEVDVTDVQRIQALANVSNQEAGYESGVFTGKMGYVVLQPETDDKTFAAQIANKPNTIFEIRDVFDLGGTQETPVSVTIPTNCTLKFNGGKIKNGTIEGDNINFDAPLVRIFDNVNFLGNCVFGDFKVEWFVDKYYDSLVTEGELQDASAQFNQMFASGVKKVSLNDPKRYYYIADTIYIHGHIDIFSLFKNYQDSGYKRSLYGNIYTLSKITMIDYFFEDSNSATLTVDGLNLMNLYGSSNDDFLAVKDIPLFYLHNKTSMWGVNLNMNITASGSYISPSVLGITTATDSHGDTDNTTPRPFYNFTGLKIEAEYDYISMVKVDGLIQKTYYGIVTEINKSHVSSNWFTDVTINADTRCNIGGILADDGVDTIYGSHQSDHTFDVGNDEGYFQSKKCVFFGYVWDLYGTKNGIQSPHYPYIQTGIITRINNAVVNNAYFDTYNVNGYVSNKIEPSFVGVNALNRAINKYSCPNFLKNANYTDTSFTFKAYIKNGDEYDNGHDAIDGMSDYYDLYYKHNLFGESICANLVSYSNASLGGVAYYRTKQQATIKFEIDFDVKYSVLQSYLWMFVYATSSAVANSLTVTLTINNVTKDYTLDTGVMQSYAERAQFFLKEGITHVKITFIKSVSNNAYYRFPNIFIPNNEYSLPALTNEQLNSNIPSSVVSSFTLPSTQLIFNVTFNEPCRYEGKRYVFLDGYSCALRKGNTENRPQNLINTDKGFKYFDETLQQYVVWNGSGWDETAINGVILQGNKTADDLGLVAKSPIDNSVDIKVLQDLLYASDLVYLDSDGYWKKVDTYTANETTGASFVSSYPNARKIISLGKLENKSSGNDLNSYLGSYGVGNVSIQEINIDIPLKDGSNTDLTSLNYAFSESTALKKAVIKGGGNVKNLSKMFFKCSNLEYCDLSGFDMSNVENIQYMFRQCENIISINMSGCDTSKVNLTSYFISSGYNKFDYFTDFKAGKTNTLKATIDFAHALKLSATSVQSIIDWLYDFVTNVPASYTPGNTYTIGDLVIYNSTTYICRSNVNNAPSELNLSFWRETTKTLTLHANAVATYDNTYGSGACQAAVEAKGWSLSV